VYDAYRVQRYIEVLTRTRHARQLDSLGQPGRAMTFSIGVLMLLDNLRQDLRHACRALTSSRGYAGWIIGSLAIGMAVTVAALALLNALLVLPFPGITDQNRLVRVAVSRNCGRPHCWIQMSSPADYAALQKGLRSVEALAAVTEGDLAVALPAARSMRGAFTSANYFDVLGVRPTLGRGFQPADGDTHAPVAVLAHDVWTREFGADPATIGQSIRVADRFVHIVGIAPPLFIGTSRIRPGGRAPDIWLPIWLADGLLEPQLSFIGRLRDGVEVSHVQAEATVLARGLAEASRQASRRTQAEVRRVWRVDPKSWHLGVMVVIPIPILVLVIACVNAANLMLARGSQRHLEIAIRLAIGARRARIVRQLLLEGAVLALCATALAVPLAWWGLQAAENPLNVSIPFDPTVFALTVLTAVVTTVAFALAPAVRVSAERPSSTLGSVSARNDAIPRQSRMRRVLVVAQVALSLGLLATAWQLVSTVRAQAVSGGTPPDRLLIARFDLQPLGLAADAIEMFYRDLVAAASRLPGVEAAGIARQTAVWTFGQRAPSGSLVVWHPSDRPDAGRTTIGGYAGGELFGAVGLRILAGRPFTESDRQLRPQVAVVNQTFARSMNGPAVGSGIRVAPRGHDLGSAVEVRVVGVIEPSLEPRLETDSPPAAKVYLPSPLEPEPALALYLRTAGEATLLAQPVRELVARIAPRVPVQELGTLEQFNERSYATQLWLARAAAVLGVIGLLLATAGLYGVSSYLVAMRSRELAIRIAVGATPQVILTMILRQSMRVAAIGLLVGGAGALVVSRVIQSEYHGIEGIDRAAFGGAAALFLGAMLLASALPALRASRVDPVESLKDA
jgi:putative ABC transport system permease protein